MPSSRILTELWRKATTSFKNIEQSTEDDARLPNREELRQHQETIQDIVDVFVATQESNAKSFRAEAVSHASAKKNSVPMISPSETSSAHSFFPPDTARSANNRIISQISPILPLPVKRKAAEIVPNVGSSSPWKKAAQQSPAVAVTKRSKHKKSSKSSLMTPEDDAYIWQEYTAHVEMVNRLKLGRSASSGLATRIAEKLHSNRQTVGVRLKALKEIHGEVGADSFHRSNAPPSRREADANSLEGGGIDGASGSDHISDSDSGSDSSSSGSSDASSACSNFVDHHNYTDSAKDNMTKDRMFPKSTTTTTATPSCSLHTVTSLSHLTAVPPRPNTTKKTSHTALAPRAPVIETPLSSPPHMARKTTFTHEDDVVLWNAYIRNGCEIPGESQLQKLVRKLNRNSTSGVAYRVNRLIAEDQKVGIKDTHPLFTSSHDEYILRKYNNNKTLSAKQRQADEALSGKIAEKLQMDPVRVYYRLQHLMRSSRRNDNNNSSHSDTNSSTSTDSTASNTSNSNNIDVTEYTHSSTLPQRTANRYSESEDMAIYSAYLSSTAESQRQRALEEVAVTLGRSSDSIQARLKRLLEDQRAVTYARNKTSTTTKPLSPASKTHLKRKRGRPKKNMDRKDNHISMSSLVANNSITTQKLSVCDLTGLNAFNPASPHAGFIHHAPHNDSISSASDNLSSQNSLDESDSDKPIAPTSTRGATIARRRQLQSLSDSSTSTCSQSDRIHATTASLPTKSNSNDSHKPTASTRTSVSPPVVPSVTPVKVISEAALAAGARLVGAREGVVDANANALPSGSTTSSSRGVTKPSTHAIVTQDTNSTAQSRSTNTHHHTTTAALSPTLTSTATDSSKPATLERRQYRAVGSNPLMKAFMSSLQRQGMDILYPQTVHDQVLALVLGCLQHLHVHTAEPPYSTVLHCLQHCLRCTAHTLPRLQHVTNAQLRSVIVLLQRAECVVLHGGPHVNTPITMRLAGGMRSFLDMRRRHDGYLETQMNTNEVLVLQDVLWPVEQKEQHRLQEEMGLVVNEIKRNL